jgi:Uma2 family endonuclease
MGAKTAITADQYLHTSFPDIDHEYREGEVMVRTMPDYLHGRTQLRLGVFFEALRATLSGAVREKLQEYRAWGVPHAWLVDPHSRRLYTCRAGLTEVTSFTSPQLSVTLSPPEIFG